MADVISYHPLTNTPVRLRDSGDGTWAEVVAANVVFDPTAITDLLGDIYALLGDLQTQINLLSLGSAFDQTFDYGSAASVVAGIETVVLTKLIATTSHVILAIAVTGNVAAKFTLYVDGSPVMSVRTSESQRWTDHKFDPGAKLKALSGQTVEIKVTHDGSGPRDFEATLFGYGLV
jgi:hypothetical protein